MQCDGEQPALDTTEDRIIQIASTDRDENEIERIERFIIPVNRWVHPVLVHSLRMNILGRAW